MKDYSIRRSLVRAWCVILFAMCFMLLYGAAAGQGECYADSGRSITVTTVLEGSETPVEGVFINICRSPDMNNPRDIPVYYGDEDDSQYSIVSSEYTGEDGKATFSNLVPNAKYYFFVGSVPGWIDRLEGDAGKGEVHEIGSSLKFTLHKKGLEINADLYWMSDENTPAPAGSYSNVWGRLEYSTDDVNWQKAPGSEDVWAQVTDPELCRGILRFRYSGDPSGKFPCTDDSGNPYFYRVKQVDGNGNYYSYQGWKEIENSSAVDRYDCVLQEPLYIKNIYNACDVTGRIIWQDVPAREPKPDVRVKLFYNNMYGEPVFYSDAWPSNSKPGSDGYIVWKGMDEYDEGESLIYYFIREVDADGNDWSNEKYSVRMNGLNIINVYTARPELSIDVSSEAEEAGTGDIIPYTVTITNNGNGKAYDLNVKDAFGSGLEYVDDDANGVCNADSSEISWTVDVSEGESTTINVRLRVTADSPDGYTNSVHIPSDDDANPAAEGKSDAECTVASKPKEQEPEPKPTPEPAPAPIPAESKVPQMKNDKDLKGSQVAPLYLRSPKQTKNSVTLKWNRVSGATRYIIYGNKCGKTSRIRKLLTVSTKTSYTVRKISGKKLKKGKYYKFFVVAVDKDDNILSISKVVHAVTKGSKWKNHKSVKVSNSAAFRNMKQGSTKKIKAKAVGSKVAVHVGLRYQSLDPKVAKVNSKGKVKAVSKGKTTILVYAQNGKCKRVKVSVK